METITEKLQYTADAIDDIQAAINEKGVAVDGSVELSLYGGKIRDIKGGGDEGTGDIRVDFLYIDPLVGEYKVVTKRCNRGDTVTAPNAIDVPAIRGVCPDLTFQGWNHELSVLTNIETNLCIGAMYIPADEKTYLYVDINKKSWFNFNFFLFLDYYDINIDWGDGGTCTRAQNIGENSFSHTYTTYGCYWITIWRNNKSYELGWDYDRTDPDNDTTVTYTSKFCDNNVTRLYTGLKVKVNRYSYDNLKVKNITFPLGVSIKDYNFDTGGLEFIKYLVVPLGVRSASLSRYNLLQMVSLPHGLLTISNTTQDYCLQRLVIPPTVTNIYRNIVKNDYGASACTELTLPNLVQVPSELCYEVNNLRLIVFQKGVIEINSRAFGGCTNIELYDFRNLIAIPVLRESYIFLRGTMVVPDSLYSDWIKATNWVAYAQDTISETDYNNTYASR